MHHRPLTSRTNTQDRGKRLVALPFTPFSSPTFFFLVDIFFTVRFSVRGTWNTRDMVGHEWLLAVVIH